MLRRSDFFFIWLKGVIFFIWIFQCQYAAAGVGPLGLQVFSPQSTDTENLREASGKAMKKWPVNRSVITGN